MTTFEFVAFVSACGVSGAVYMAPYLLAVGRATPDHARILLINLCLGWTIVGWLWALSSARRSRRRADPIGDWSGWRAGRPESAGASRASSSTYADGSYLVSEAGGARTWAICSAGHWGIAFELDGVQRTATWVDSSDVPVEVLAQALACRPEYEQ